MLSSVSVGLGNRVIGKGGSYGKVVNIEGNGLQPV
jgi:hypothetical protein